MISDPPTTFMNLFPRPSYKRSQSLTQLPVDAAYAYDYLAILYVKQERGLDVKEEVVRVEAALSGQHANYREVLASEAFRRLRDANEQVFDIIERAHRNDVSARQVQLVNMKRFTAKKKLQEEFWPMTVLNETKTALGKT